jgi:hypothetical protein
VDVVGAQWVKQFEGLTSVFAGVFAVLIYSPDVASGFEGHRRWARMMAWDGEDHGWYRIMLWKAAPRV